MGRFGVPGIGDKVLWMFQDEDSSSLVDAPERLRLSGILLGAADDRRRRWEKEAPTEAEDDAELGLGAASSKV